MENLVLRQYRRLKYSDLFSAIFGIIGIVNGVTSIVALQNPWNSSRDSSILTIISLIFDTLSTFMAVQAFLISNIIREIKITNKVYIRKRERIAGRLDFASFLTGITGLVCGWISLIALFSFWNDDLASVIATAFSVTLDFWSAACVLGAVFLIESIHNKYFTNEPTRGIKAGTRISRRKKTQRHALAQAQLTKNQS